MTLDPVSSGDPHVPAHNAERAAINQLQDDLDTKISLPSGAATGDLLRWDGTQWLTTETRLFEGNGSPNGVISAPVGSRYVDKLATNGIVEWTKTQDGSANTGWTTQRGVTGGAQQLTSAPTANALSGPATITFPAGRFSSPPAVSAIASDANILNVWAASVTATGFDVYWKSQSGNRQFTLNWTAVVKG